MINNFWKTISYKDTTERAVKQDILLKTITCILLACVSGILTILNVVKHFTLMSITTIILTVGLLIAAFLCGYLKRIDAATVLVAALGMFIFTYYAVTGANEGFAILWITMVPLISMLWMGLRIGFFVSLYFVILLDVIFYSDIRVSMSAHYTEIFMIRFPILYFATFVVSVWIFYQKLKSHMLSDNAGRRDALTNIDNRLGYELKRKTLFANGRIPCLHVVAFDINCLKKINDENGHKAGDELIIAASEIIAKSFFDYTVFARIGGDEFVLLSTSESFDFEGSKERLCSLCDSWKGEEAPFLAISCGHAVARDITEKEYTGLLQAADYAMYEDKDCFYKSTGLERRKGNL